MKTANELIKNKHLRDYVSMSMKNNQSGYIASMGFTLRFIIPNQTVHNSINHRAEYIKRYR